MRCRETKGRSGSTSSIRSWKERRRRRSTRTLCRTARRSARLMCCSLTVPGRYPGEVGRVEVEHPPGRRADDRGGPPHVAPVPGQHARPHDLVRRERGEDAVGVGIARRGRRVFVVLDLAPAPLSPRWRGLHSVERLARARRGCRR